DIAIRGLQLQVSGHVLDVDVLGPGEDKTAGPAEVVAPHFVAGDFQIAGHRSNLHVRPRRLEGHSLGDLAEADIVEEVAVEMDRAGHFIDGGIVDTAFHLKIACNLGGAHRTALQADVHGAADIVQGNVRSEEHTSELQSLTNL